MEKTYTTSPLVRGDIISWEVEAVIEESACQDECEIFHTIVTSNFFRVNNFTEEEVALAVRKFNLTEGGLGYWPHMDKLIR